MEHLFKMDDLGVQLFSETPINCDISSCINSCTLWFLVQKASVLAAARGPFRRAARLEEARPTFTSTGKLHRAGPGTGKMVAQK